MTINLSTITVKLKDKNHVNFSFVHKTATTHTEYSTLFAAIQQKKNIRSKVAWRTSYHLSKLAGPHQM
jgi:alpha-D-ribose 1-methylphosphonate 5-triphosphate synthase subunit PhnG